MTRRLTRRAFHATSATMGAGALSEMLRVPCFENSAGAEQKDDEAKHVAGISADMPWQRQGLPVLSATTMRFDWCKTYCHSPHVFRTTDGYRMYFIGHTRTEEAWTIKDLMGFVIGTATSKDGLNWEAHPHPVLTHDQVPWGTFGLQTPHVLWDEDEQLFKLWFAGFTEWIYRKGVGALEYTARLGYATSADGIRWDVYPEPIFESSRRPCVHKEERGAYRMWMNARPSRKDHWESLYQNVYEFRSADGIQWKRSDKAVLRASTQHRKGCIYPFVCREQGRYFLWYCAYPKREIGGFQIYLAESEDGTNWLNHDSQSAFPTSNDRTRFDSIYVSTPCMLVEPNRYLLYYSAVSWTHREKGSYYEHIGVAVCPRGSA